MLSFPSWKTTAVDVRLHKREKKSKMPTNLPSSILSSHLRRAPHTAVERDNSLSWRLSIVRKDGTSPWDLPGGLNTHRPPWTSTDALHDPQHTLPLSHSLSLAVTHADEMFFNTQSTVLTSPWVAGSPEGHMVLILRDCGSVVP